MVGVRERALEASLQNTEIRTNRVAQEIEASENRTTALVIFGGIDSATGKAFGRTVRDDVLYFDLATNSIPSVGEAIEVAIPYTSIYGKGDKRPVK